MSEPLSTQSYKGVRDFYPEDMAVQQYIFDTWGKTAASFGFSRYDASVLEPAALYKAKGAQNEEMVNDQTYTFTDRGDREVTLRPEMTPTVARMIAGKRRELAFPARWFSIPNLFRYERTQRGRLREHWQLNCDIFGGDVFTSDIEMILLARQVLLDFGATDDMFTIRVNDRAHMTRLYHAIGVTDEMIPAITRLNDKKDKISADDYRHGLHEITNDKVLSEEVIMLLENSDSQTDIMFALSELGVTNAVFDKTLARGFDYYTGTVFEIFDTSDDNNRSLLGGGRYDNLTTLFGGEPISGVGFGMGDVTMRDFLETHSLLEGNVPAHAATVAILPMSAQEHLSSLTLANELRAAGISCSIDTSDRKIGKKINTAAEAGAVYVLTVGEDEVASGSFVIKNLKTGQENTGTIAELLKTLA